MECAFVGVFEAIVLYVAWRFVRGGRLVGALVGGSIDRECCEISLYAGRLAWQRLKVCAMTSSGGELFVVYRCRGEVADVGEHDPFKFTYEQAQDLATILMRTCDLRMAGQGHGRQISP